MVATDLQTKFLEAIEASNLEVRKHDITQGDLEHEKFDLVSARKVLEHLPEPSQALSRLAAAVRPGGWLLVEDTDLATRRHFSCAHPQRVERAYLKFIETMSSAGFQPTYAKRVADELRQSGFQGVQFVCPIPVGFTFPEELRVLGLEPSEQKHFPKKVEWNLNADTPFQERSHVFSVKAGDVVMDVITRPPNGATFERRAASVKAPGPPGSLTSGSIEERGHQFVITAPPATRFLFETTLRARREMKAAVAR